MAKGKHPVNALTAMGLSKLSVPGRYTDGNGLHLVIDRSGAKHWVLRTVVRGRRRDMGLVGQALARIDAVRPIHIVEQSRSRLCFPTRDRVT